MTESKEIVRFIGNLGVKVRAEVAFYGKQVRDEIASQPQTDLSVEDWERLPKATRTLLVSRLGEIDHQLCLGKT